MNSVPDRPRYGAEIVGTGHYVPRQVLTNHDLEKMVVTSDEWITTRTGVKERRIVDNDETSGTMALEASRRALDDAGMDPAELDMIIVCTVTPERAVPSTACLLQQRLGISGRFMPAFDLAAACTGFIYGLATAHAHMQLGQVRTALVVGTETLSRMTNYAERNTSIIFGDGAGAMVLRRSDGADRGLLHTRLYADGEGSDLISVPGGLNARHGPEYRLRGDEYFIRMDGPKVFKLAVNRMEEAILEATRTCGVEPRDINLLVPHQANLRILDSVADKLNFPSSQMFVNIHRYGNTSAASIPIAFDEARQQGLLHRGDLAMLVAFGAGLTWGSALVRL